MTVQPKFPVKAILSDMPENAITERIIKSAIEAQVLTYLKITGKRVGLLINFNSRLVKDGIKRFILS